MNRTWSERRERGTLTALVFVRWLALSMGRRIARLSLYPAVLWYLLRAREEQNWVRDFLRRVLPRSPRFGDVVRTYWNFGAVTLDRVFLLAGRDGTLDIRVHGAETLLELHERGQGAILVGAHLGSFEAMRAVGMRRQGLRIRILQYVSQSPLITRVFSGLDHDLADAVVPLGTPDVLVRLSELIGDGEFVALLPDRVSPDEARTVVREFLGGRACFGTGGFEAALILGCPILFFAGLYRGRCRYDLHFELLNEGRFVPRCERGAEVERLAGRYVCCLERYARESPYNWFNFYPYWES